MRVIVNHTEYEVPQDSKVSDILALIDAKAPYAVAVNLTFIPKALHDQHTLQAEDRVEVIAPVTGG